MPNNTDSTGRIGISAVGLIFEQLGWAFREQPTSDFGIDAQAEKRGSDGIGIGKLIAMQIKTGPSWFRKRGEDYVYYGEERHLEYWTSHSLPVYIILHNPEDNLTLFQRVEQHLVKMHSNGRWSITIPATNTLDAANEPFLAAAIAPDDESVRRYRLTLDLPTIRFFADQKCAWLRLEDWHNKTLNFRGVDIVFDENPDADADFELGWMASLSGVDRFMELFFPWLDYTIYNVDADCGAGEITVHTLEVALSAVGKAALVLDDYYRDGVPPLPKPKSITDAVYGDYMSSLDSVDSESFIIGEGSEEDWQRR